eukprot:765705-Hanusia_phi.AAC.2
MTTGELGNHRTVTTVHRVFLIFLYYTHQPHDASVSLSHNMRAEAVKAQVTLTNTDRQLLPPDPALDGAGVKTGAGADVTPASAGGQLTPAGHSWSAKGMWVKSGHVLRGRSANASSRMQTSWLEERTSTPKLDIASKTPAGSVVSSL